MFNWEQYLEFARGCILMSSKGFCSEASLRSATSRAYYASFHMAKDKGIAKGIVNSTAMQAESHKKLIEAFSDKKNTPEVKNIGNMLNRLKKSRVICDYQDTINGNLEKRTQADLITAEAIIANLKTV